MAGRRARGAALVVALSSALLAASGAARSDEQGPVVVEVGPELDGEVGAAEVRDAIGRELRADAVAPSATTAQRPRGRLRVDIDRKGRKVLMRYQSASGSVLQRTVPLTEGGRDELRRTIALLAGNLARDEASELLSSLRPSASASASASAPASAASAPGSAALGGGDSVQAGARTPPVAPSSAPSSSPSSAAASSSGAPAASAPASAVAEPPAPPRDEPAAARDDNRCAGRPPLTAPFVASVAGPIATLPRAKEYTVNGSVSLFFGQVGGLDGGAFTALVTRVEGDARWLSYGGIGSSVGGSVDGVIGGGIFAIAGCGVRGAMVSGIVNVSGGELWGAQVGGIYNGARLGVRGAQVGLVNEAGGETRGAQVGLVNVGGRVKGAQVGLVNLSEHLDGVAVGLVNVAGNGTTRFAAFYSSRAGGEVALRFVAAPFTSTLSLSFAPGDQRFGASASVGAALVRGALVAEAGLQARFDGPVLDAGRLRGVFEPDPWVGPRLLGGLRLADHLTLLLGGALLVSTAQETSSARVLAEVTGGVQF